MARGGFYWNDSFCLTDRGLLMLCLITAHRFAKVLKQQRGDKASHLDLEIP